MTLEFSTYLFFPVVYITYQAPTAPTPVLDPLNEGETYAPPDQVAIPKNAYYLN